MAKIENTDIIKKIIGRWHPGDLALIKNIKYLSQNEESDSEIIIDALFQKKERAHSSWPSNQQPWYSVSIQFVGIKNFKIKGIGSSPKQVMGFDIIDITDKGWEGSNFQIEDYEDGVIEFYSKKVRILSAEENYEFMI